MTAMNDRPPRALGPGGTGDAWAISRSMAGQSLQTLASAAVRPGLLDHQIVAPQHRVGCHDTVIALVLGDDDMSTQRDVLARRLDLPGRDCERLTLFAP